MSDLARAAKIRTSARKLLAEHVIPRSFIDQVLKRLGKVAGIPMGKSEYNAMTTILIYNSAADRKNRKFELQLLDAAETGIESVKIGGDFTRIPDFKRGLKAAESFKTRFDRKHYVQKYARLVYVPLATEAIARTVRAVEADYSMMRDIRKGEPLAPDQGEVEKAGTTQRHELRALIDAAIAGK
jgi:hypothetical protein